MQRHARRNAGTLLQAALDRRAAGHAADPRAASTRSWIHRPQAKGSHPRAAAGRPRRLDPEHRDQRRDVRLPAGIHAGADRHHRSDGDPEYPHRRFRLDAGLGAARHRQRAHHQGARLELRPGHDARRPPGQHQHRPLRAHVSCATSAASAFRPARATKAASARAFWSRWRKTKTARARSAGRPTARTAVSTAGENVVTVHSVVAITSPMYSGGRRAIDHVQQWAEVIGGSFTLLGAHRIQDRPLESADRRWPEHRRRDREEWSKDQVRRYLYEHIKVTAERATHYARMTSTPTFSFEHLVSDGILPPEYTESSDPQRLIQRLHRSRRWSRSWSPAIPAATSRAATWAITCRAHPPAEKSSCRKTGSPDRWEKMKMLAQRRIQFGTVLLFLGMGQFASAVAVYPERPDPPDHSVRSRRRHRSDGACDRIEAHRSVGINSRARQSRRRQRYDRGGHRDQVAARRLHADDDFVEPFRQFVALQAAVRSHADLAPITQATTQPYALVVHPSVAAKSVKELIALAKAKPDSMTYGSSGWEA